MTEIIAGVEIPETQAAAEATRLVQDTTSPLIFHHSRRVFLFSTLQARELGLQPDPELLYLSSLFHDTGLLTPFSDVEQRFELDGADHARKFLLDRGFSAAAAEVVWTAIALHTTPGIPGRMGDEVAATHFGASSLMWSGWVWPDLHRLHRTIGAVEGSCSSSRRPSRSSRSGASNSSRNARPIAASLGRPSGDEARDKVTTQLHSTAIFDALSFLRQHWLIGNSRISKSFVVEHVSLVIDPRSTSTARRIQPHMVSHPLG
ncbi:HD domain-containing protein [Rhodococcus opacus]|nr:HD domain-containing protein [Rhodococcus opacus]